tara:strand:- start:318 stop:476 length:159 start_codon:yes stop_codon:yes gene_type:complete
MTLNLAWLLSGGKKTGTLMSDEAAFSENAKNTMEKGVFNGVVRPTLARFKTP